MVRRYAGYSRRTLVNFPSFVFVLLSIVSERFLPSSTFAHLRNSGIEKQGSDTDSLSQSVAQAGGKLSADK